MTKVINLLGGPGCGKSTTAAGLFFELKSRDINCEYVQEVAKDLTWAEHQNALKCQPYVLGEQYYRLFRLKDKVDVIITDAPLLLSIIYNQHYSEALNLLAYQLYNEFDNTNFLLKRLKVYNPKGRNQNEAESINIDGLVENLMSYYGLSYTMVDGNKDAPKLIAEQLMAQKWLV